MNIFGDKYLIIHIYSNVANLKLKKNSKQCWHKFVSNLQNNSNYKCICQKIFENSKKAESFTEYSCPIVSSNL